MARKELVDILGADIVVRESPVIQEIIVVLLKDCVCVCYTVEEQCAINRFDLTWQFTFTINYNKPTGLEMINFKVGN